MAGKALTVKVNELVTVKLNKTVALTFPTYGEDERAWNIPAGWQQVSYETLDRCGGDVTLTTSSYRRGDYALHASEYLRANETEISYTLTRA